MTTCDAHKPQAPSLRRNTNLRACFPRLVGRPGSRTVISNFDALRTIEQLGSVGGDGAVLRCEMEANSVPAWCVHATPAGDSESESLDDAAEPPRPSESKGTVTVPLELTVKLLAGANDAYNTTAATPRHHAFLTELRALSEMSPHPNIVALLANFVKPLPAPMHAALPDGMKLVARPSDPVMALVTRYHRRTLQAAARADSEPAPSGEQLLQWCLQVSSAVAHVWQLGWVHMDLKPEHVLVADAEDGRALLAHFGAAMRVEDDGTVSATLGTGLKGNRAHRAPEVVRAWERARREHAHDPAHTVRLDSGRQEVWALGVLIHELLTGKHPYGAAYPATLVGDDYAAMEPKVDEPVLLERGMPGSMVAVLRRLIDRDPTARPPTPAVAHAELMASAPTAIVLASSPSTSASKATAAASESTVKRKTGRWRSPRKALAELAARLWQSRCSTPHIAIGGLVALYAIVLLHLSMSGSLSLQPTSEASASFNAPHVHVPMSEIAASAPPPAAPVAASESESQLEASMMPVPVSEGASEDAGAATFGLLGVLRVVLLAVQLVMDFAFRFVLYTAGFLLLLPCFFAVLLTKLLQPARAKAKSSEAAQAQADKDFLIMYRGVLLVVVAVVFTGVQEGAAAIARQWRKRTSGILYTVGACYEHGTFVTKDLGRAEGLYRRAAEYGHADARAGLARVKQPLERESRGWLHRLGLRR